MWFRHTVDYLALSTTGLLAATSVSQLTGVAVPFAGFAGLALAVARSASRVAYGPT